MSFFNDDFVDFFKELAANNNKAWFDENRTRYKKTVKEPFALFVAELIDQIKKIDPAVQIMPKDAIFRINRDIRFSKDKTPYKTQVSAIVSPGGRKDKTSPGLYIELDPEKVRIYGGVYMADKNQLLAIRRYITSNLKGFEKAIQDKTFLKYYGEIRGEKNKRIPTEFKEPVLKQSLIANKQFYYFGELSPKKITDPKLADLVLEYYKAATPVRNFLTEALA